MIHYFVKLFPFVKHFAGERYQQLNNKPVNWLVNRFLISILIYINYNLSNQYKEDIDFRQVVRS